MLLVRTHGSVGRAVVCSAGEPKKTTARSLVARPGGWWVECSGASLVPPRREDSGRRSWGAASLQASRRPWLVAGAHQPQRPFASSVPGCLKRAASVRGAPLAGSLASRSGGACRTGPESGLICCVGVQARGAFSSWASSSASLGRSSSRSSKAWPQFSRARTSRRSPAPITTTSRGSLSFSTCHAWKRTR